MTRRLIAAVVLILLLAAGLGFQRYWQAARDDIQQARLAQCAVAYELVLRQLLERADLPGGQASAALLTQLQILESQPCGERRLADTLTPGGGVGHLLPLARAANTPEGLSVFVAALYPLLQTVGERATAGASPQNRVRRVQSRYREAMPMFGRLEQGASTADRMAFQKHLESVRRDFAAGADSDRFERARVAYNESLQKLALALDRSAPGVAVAVSRARSGLSRLYDEAIVGQNAALQTRIETRQLDQKLALVALFILAAILLVAGLLTAAAIERDRRRRLQGLVQVSRRTAQGELGLVVDARRGGGKVSELEQAFNEMTADLSRRYQKIIDELKVALDSAKAAERAKSDFLHNVSHEIRTPMNAILGMSHLALQTPLDRRQKDYIGTIHKEAKSLIALVNDILDFSSIAAGKMSAESIEFDLQDVLDPLLADTRGKAVAKGLRFEADIAPSVPMALVGDPQRLGQILAHYASNALKFTERGLIRFELAMVAGAAQADAAPVGLRFAFTDTGIGISDEQKAGLFQSIRQGDGSATRKHGGTGLGLVLSRQLATLLGGTVGVESVAGQGSTFWLQLNFGRARTLVAREPVVAAAVEPPASEAAAPVAVASRELPAFDAALLDTLQGQIDSYDSQAGETVGQLRDALGDTAPALLLQIDDCLNRFAFEEATALLPALRAALGPA